MRNIEQYTKTYQNSAFEEIQARYRQKRVRRSLEETGRNEKSIILEVGCGIDSLMNHIDSFGAYYMVDPSKEFYEKACAAREKHTCKEQIFCIHDYAENAVEQLQQVQFTHIVISSLLHELEDPKKLLAGLKQICTKDTIIHINVPNAKSMHRVLAYEAGLIASIEEKSENNLRLQQKMVFSKETLLALLSETGSLDILSCGTWFVKPFTHWQMQQCLSEGIFDERVLDGFERLIQYMPDMGSILYVDFRYRV